MSFQFDKQFIKLRRLISRPDEKNAISAGFFPPRIREKARQLCLRKRGRLLEVGCGEGFFLTELTKSVPGLEIIGIDSSDQILKSARERIKNNRGVGVKFGEAKNLPFDNAYFTTVVCLNMLYNLRSKQDVEEVITEMARVCKQKGSIIFDVRNRRNPCIYYGYKWVRFYDSNCSWPLKAYRLEEIEEILNRLKLTILKIVPIGFPFCRFAPVLVIEAQKRLS